MPKCANRADVYDHDIGANHYSGGENSGRVHVYMSKGMRVACLDKKNSAVSS